MNLPRESVRLPSEIKSAEYAQRKLKYAETHSHIDKDTHTHTAMHKYKAKVYEKVNKFYYMIYLHF